VPTPTRLSPSPVAPIINPTGPAATAPSRRPSGCAKTPVSSVTPATSPVTATASCGIVGVSSSGSTVTAVDGKVNTPTAIGSTTSMKGSRAEPGTPMLISEPVRRAAGGSVSGTPGSSASPMTISATCTRYGSTVGNGTHCPSSPDTSGPIAQPPPSAAVVSRAARPGSPTSSPNQAVPTLNTTPDTAPWRNRQVNSSSADDPAPRNSSEVATDSSTNGITTARRPKRSEAGPASSSAGTRPAA
jgi:hypothetical protein